MEDFIHIGVPKTLTTALQKEFFAKHPEIYYLGVGADGEIGYRDEELERLFEHLVLYARTEVFEEEAEAARARLRDHREKAQRSGKRAFGLSLEWLSFRFSADMVETRTIAHRLSQLLSPQTRILMVLRRQDRLLGSLYNEYVKNGLPLGWEEFLDYIYKFRERNFFTDLCYDRLVATYGRFFEEEGLDVNFLEDFRASDGSLRQKGNTPLLVEHFTSTLALSPMNVTLEHHNPTLPTGVLAHKLALNRTVPHDFGNTLFEHATLHRQRSAHAKDRELLSLDIYRDVRTKRMMIQEARERSSISPPELSEVQSEEETPVHHWLMERFRSSNARLSELIGRPLPTGYELRQR